MELPPPPEPAARDPLGERAVRALRDRLRFVLGLGDSPHRLALGAAIGVFVACTPFWGAHLAASALLALLLGANRPAALTFTFLANPLTAAPLYGGAFLLGRALLGQSGAPPVDFGAMELSWAGAKALFSRVPDVLLPLLLGCGILGAGASALSYALVRRLLLLRRAEEAA